MNTVTVDQIAKVPLWPSIGFGKERETINVELEHAKDDLMSVHSIGSSLYDIQLELDAIYDECAEDNWDGYGAMAISLETIEIAERFANCFLFTNLPIPDIIPEPTDTIAFEWERSAYNTLIVSINSTGEIAYVGMFGSNRSKGIEKFTDSVPEQIVNNLKRLFS